MLNILITGKNGFIGKELTDFFTKTDHTVFATCRKTLDVSDEQQVDDFFEKNNIDIVLHAAIRGGRRTQKDTYCDLVKNLTMFKNLLKHHKHYKLMISFGSGAEINNTTYYGVSKNLIAQEIAKHDGNIVNLRLFGCFGPQERSNRFIKNSINSLLLNNPIIIHQDKYMDYFYIDDLKKVVQHYIENYTDVLPKEVDLCYPTKLRLLDIAEEIKNLTTNEVNVIVEDKTQGSSYVGSSFKLADLNLQLGGLKEGIRKMLTEATNSG
ncbi:MAG: hypothetical protein CMB80_04705 [Flammeovirgaceae bacterium]|nr:hypothetical protein [Flammeovirgaceae bacterium]